MKSGFCTIAMKDRPVTEAIEAAARAGAESIELWGRAPHLPDLGDLMGFERLRKNIRDAGLVLAALGSYYRPDATDGDRPVPADPKDTEGTIGFALEAAVRLQAPIVRIWGGERNYSDYSDAQRRVVMRQIIRFADLASEEGLQVVLERHNRTLTNEWDTTERVVQTIRERVEHPELFGLCYQVPYPVPADELRRKFASDAQALMHVSLHCHLQNYQVPDTNTEDHRYPRTFLKDGIVDYSKLSPAARAAGYEGWGMIEFLPDERGSAGTDEALAKDIAFTKTL